MLRLPEEEGGGCDLMLDGEGPDSPILELGDWSSELGVGATIPRWGLHNRSGASGCRSAVMIRPASWMLLLALLSPSSFLCCVFVEREGRSMVEGAEGYGDDCGLEWAATAEHFWIT